MIEAGDDYAFGRLVSETPGCRFELNATDTAQEITSPGYPDGYNNSLLCNWNIR